MIDCDWGNYLLPYNLKKKGIASYLLLFDWSLVKSSTEVCTDLAVDLRNFSLEN